MTENLQEKVLSTKINAIIHSIFWLIILQLLFDISGLYYSFHLLFIDKNDFFDDAFLIIPIMMTLFYWNSYFLIPKYLQKKTWWKYLIGLLVSFFFSVFFAQTLYLFFAQKGYHFHADTLEFWDNSIFLNIIVLSISSSLAISQMAMQNAAQKKEAQEKQKEAELKFLTAQVNPHFLFNTLNAIYVLAATEEAMQTTEAILKLSEIMRYPLNEGTKKIVSLEQEITFLRDYIDLQKLRLDENYPIHFEVKGDAKAIKIAPFLLITFVENAFKYGISQQQAQAIDISILCAEKEIYFRCSNYIVKQKKVESHHLGLQNAKARLELLYPNAYTLTNKMVGNRYVVALKIKV